jgi:hypothetical protein
MHHLLNHLSSMESEKIKISPLAFKLGIAGLIPFVALAGLTFIGLSPYKNIIILSLLGYGACICSFLGAIHWGLTMRDTTPNKGYLIWGVIPSLIGWISLIIRPEIGLLLITALLWICFFVDSKIYPKYTLAHWLPMRLILTITSSVSCLIAANN